MGVLAPRSPITVRNSVRPIFSKAGDLSICESNARLTIAGRDGCRFRLKLGEAKGGRLKINLPPKLASPTATPTVDHRARYKRCGSRFGSSARFASHPSARMITPGRHFENRGETIAWRRKRIARRRYNAAELTDCLIAPTSRRAVFEYCAAVSVAERN